MHKVGKGHAALASDLIEELRAPIVDRNVVDLVNSGEVCLEDFETTASGAVYMKRGSVRHLATLLSDCMVKPHRYFSEYGDSRSYGFQYMLDKKIHSIIEAIDNSDATLYRPFLWNPEE